LGRAQLWGILEPVIRAGETWALDRGMSEDAAWAYWTAPDRSAFVAKEDGNLLGTYFLRANYPGGGAHIANTGYMVAQDAGGRGVGRALCQHSMDTAKAQGFRAMQFNFVVATNASAMHLWRMARTALLREGLSPRWLHALRPSCRKSSNRFRNKGERGGGPAAPGDDRAWSTAPHLAIGYLAHRRRESQLRPSPEFDSSRCEEHFRGFGTAVRQQVPHRG
jgi:GNAT superfamily N-acetyltransferase